MKKIKYLLLLLIAVCLPTYILSLTDLRPIKIKKKYRYQLAAVLMFQNEAGCMLAEWIEYNKLIGFDHFYLFDNASTDNYMEILQPYIDSGEVELYHYPQISNSQSEHAALQYSIYTKALSLAKGKVKWLAIIDADEFIVPIKGKSLLKVLKQYENVGGVYVNWLPFGTSHVDKVPNNQLMIEALTYCAATASNLGKSIVRPERVSGCTDAHRMWYHLPYYHVNTNYETFNWICPIADDKLLIHHYYTGDLYHLINIKFPRRQKWTGIELESYIQSLEWLNAVHNPAMLRFVPALKERLL